MTNNAKHNNMGVSMVKVAVGSDDVYPAVEFIVKYLSEKGYEVIRYGAPSSGKLEPWPTVARDVARAVAKKQVDWGIVICYTGTGVSIVANKIRGIRAALCNDAETARGARLWNDANILALSGRLVTPYLAREIIDAWLSVSQPDQSEIENIKLVAIIEEEELKSQYT